MNLQKQYGVAIVACGSRGKAHAAAWATLENVSIRVVTDVDEERAKQLAGEHGAETTEKYRTAIDRDDVHIVSVCTPAGAHADPTVFAAEHGKHILCEKPMALTLADGTRMMDAADRNGVKLSFSPSGNSLTIRKGEEQTVLEDLPRGGDPAQAAAFLACIEEDTEPRNTGRDAFIALQTSLAALESVETGEAVPIDV